MAGCVDRECEETAVFENQLRLDGNFASRAIGVLAKRD
jgi:hypothetical protein